MILSEHEMRGSPGPFKRLSEDATLDFVKWLTTRTQQRVATWQVCPCVMRTFIPGPHGPLLIQFAVDATLPRPRAWRLFTVTRAAGGELIRATPTTNRETAPPSACAIDALFFTICNTHRPPSFIS
jgi:hypothetical protein